MNLMIILRNLLLLVSPFLIMVFVNEGMRTSEQTHNYEVFNDTPTMNSGERTPEYCTWACHNRTKYCLGHHIQHLTPYLEYTNIPYFGIIQKLKNTENYAIANIFVFVIIAPLFIWFFIIKSLSLQRKINAIRNKPNSYGSTSQIYIFLLYRFYYQSGAFVFSVLL